MYQDSPIAVPFGTIKSHFAGSFAIMGPMATNDYDKYAEQRAKEFAAGTNLVHAYIEKPAMYELLPNLEGKNVLCIGCGTGEECAELQSRGANVTGIDVSADSISYASSHAPGALFQTLDMDNVPALKKLGSLNSLTLKPVSLSSSK